MASNGTEIGTQDERFAWALAAGMTVPNAATVAGFSLRTARRRMRSDDFMTLFRRIRREQMNEANGIIRTAKAKAARALERLIDDPKQDPEIVVKVSKILFDADHQAVLEQEIEERLTALEKRR